MKVTLVNPNIHSTPKPPLGLLSIATAIKQQGHEVSILDANLLNAGIDDAVKRCAAADIVGITAMSPGYHIAVDIARKLKSMPVVIGGVHASVFAKEIAKTKLFSAVVAGEGESVIPDLLSDAAVGKLQPIYHGVPGEISPLDYSLLDLAAYKPRYPHGERTLWTSVSTSRGCPYQCTFCSKAVSGSKYRSMPAGAVMELLYDLYRRGVRDITFYDDEFTLDRDRVMDICNLLDKGQLDITWCCESRVDRVDCEMLEAMREAGCRMIMYGIESGDQRVLDNLNKKITLDQARHAVNKTHKAGIEAAGYFMVGCPGETMASMRDTLNFAFILELDHAQFSVCSPLPGSELYQQYGNGKDWQQYAYLSDYSKVLIPNKGVSAKDIEKAVSTGNAYYARRARW